MYAIKRTNRHRAPDRHVPVRRQVHQAPLYPPLRRHRRTPVLLYSDGCYKIPKAHESRRVTCRSRPIHHHKVSQNAKPRRDGYDQYPNCLRSTNRPLAKCNCHYWAKEYQQTPTYQQYPIHLHSTVLRKVYRAQSGPGTRPKKLVSEDCR